jgi:hypothetical protein
MATYYPLFLYCLPRKILFVKQFYEVFMKLILSGLILLAAFGFGFAQEDAKPNIEVMTFVIGQKSCLKESSYILRNGETQEYKNVRIDIELQNALANKSDLLILLNKRGGTVWGYSIFEKKFDSTVGRQMSATGFSFSYTEKYKNEGDVPSDWFSVLNKGQTLKLNPTQVRIFFNYAKDYADYNDRDFLMDFAFFTVEGGIPEEKDFDILRQRWSKIGYLWFESLETKLVSIHFPNQESLKSCED